MSGTEWSNKTEGDRSKSEEAKPSVTEGRRRGRYRVFMGRLGMQGDDNGGWINTIAIVGQSGASKVTNYIPGNESIKDHASKMPTEEEPDVRSEMSI